MNNQVDFLIMAEGGYGIACRHCCNSKQPLDVRDLTTRSDIRVPADQVSLYRHTLLLAGEAYRILNIFKTA